MNVKIQNGEGDAEIRIATLNPYHADDLEGECSKCHRPIYYRPEPPYLVTFLCVECGLPLLNRASDVRISSKTADMIRAITRNA